MSHASATEHGPGEPQRGFIGWWHRTPLYLRILGALILGVLVAVLVSPEAGTYPLPGNKVLKIGLQHPKGAEYLHYLEIPSKLILRLLSTLAPALILFAIINALLRTEIRGRLAQGMFALLVVNTLVAIMIGLLVANVVRPGKGASLKPKPDAPWAATSQHPMAQNVVDILWAEGFKQPKKPDPLVQFLDNVPPAILQPLAEANKVLGVIFIAVTFGIALRRFRRRAINTVEAAVAVGFDALLVVLHWVIDLVPLGVFGIVVSIVGKSGFAQFQSLGLFILAVLLALFLQCVYYLTGITLFSWVRAGHLLKNTRDALVMAFSTASSTATMPVTFSLLRDRVRLRERSASMGALVGSNFNNDGTALYEAMSALFIAQMLGMELTLIQQGFVVLTSIAASVGAAGIPEAGLVTMTMVFTAVGLPVEYIALLLTVDWFLDRCRTTVNVMGDMNVSCILDGKHPETEAERHEAAALEASATA